MFVYLIILVLFGFGTSSNSENDTVVLEGIYHINPNELWEEDANHCRVCIETLTNTLEDIKEYGEDVALGLLADNTKQYPLLWNEIVPNLDSFLNFLIRGENKKGGSEEISLTVKVLCRRLERQTLEICKLDPYD